MSLGIYKLQKSFYFYFIFVLEEGISVNQLIISILCFFFFFWTNLILSDGWYTAKFAA